MIEEQKRKLTQEEKFIEQNNMQKLSEWKFHRRRKLSKICWTCGSIMKKLTIHHVYPLGEGGLDIVQNQVRLCEDCHKQIHLKSNLSERQWDLRLIKLRILNYLKNEFKKEF